jgi:hypothetical protein
MQIRRPVSASGPGSPSAASPPAPFRTHSNAQLFTTPLPTTWLLLLNNALTYDALACVYKLAGMRMAADGAANVVFDEGLSALPDAVHGDLDSLRPEVAA